MRDGDKWKAPVTGDEFTWWRGQWRRESELVGFPSYQQRSEVMPHPIDDMIDNLIKSITNDAPEMFIASQKFEEDEETAAHYRRLLAEMRDINPKDVAAVFVNVLYRPTGDAPCAGCGEVHPDGEGLSMMAGACGTGALIKAGILTSIKKMGF